MTKINIGKYEVFIIDEVFDILSRFKQYKRNQHEAGGVLLGQVKDQSIYVLRVSLPTSKDRSTRTSFIRNKENAQIVIDYEFANSSNKTIYMGEWHTHPDELPSPSLVDIKMITDQFNDNQLNEPFLLLLIQGTSGFYLGLIEENEIKGLRLPT